MKKIIIAIIILSFVQFNLFSQGYNINCKIKGYTQNIAYLGYYWGEQQILIDTAILKEKNILNFNSSNNLSGGIYFIELADKTTFNFIADGTLQNFEIKTKIPELQNNLSVSKSDENKIYSKYLSTVIKYKKKFEGNSYGYEQEIQKFVSETTAKYPQLFVCKYLKMIYNNTNRNDFFSSFDFADNRILKTEIYKQKIEYYLNTYATGSHDNIINETTMLIEKSQANKDIFKYTADYVMSRYKDKDDITNKKVFIALVKKYYLSGKANWISEKFKNEINELVDNKQFDIATHHNTIDIYQNYLSDYPNGIHKDKAISNIEDLKFEIAGKQNTVESFQLYLKEYPQGKYKAKAESSIEDLKFNIAKNKNTVSSFQNYLSEYPNGLYKDKALENIEYLKFQQAVSTNTISGFNQFTNEYPNSRYNSDVAKYIEKIKYNSAKQINTEEAYKNYIAEYPNGDFVKDAKAGIDKLYEKQRRNELLEASKLGLDALQLFVSKYPNTNEAQIASNAINRYNIENNQLDKKVYVSENFYWVAEGNRDWLNDFYETSRNSISGGKRYNIFAFATVQNKTNDFIKLKVQVNLNLIVTSNVSIFYNVSNSVHTSDYYLELGPKQQQSLLVLFNDISEGISFGKSQGDYSLGGSLLSFGSDTKLADKPIDIILHQHKGDLPKDILDKQNKLITEVRNNKGNIKVNNKSQSDVMNEWLDGWLGTSSTDQAYLYVYFTKKNSGEEMLRIYDDKNKLVKEEKFSSSGSQSESYSVTANKTYTVSVPGCLGSFSVYVRKKITHLIIDSDCKSKINTEDQEK